ncbi:citrate lyase subunit alpha [Candidatus Epulonipiscium fishelsonii]|uniref:Citrate lyase subunit alpha n=1 Tax=Candidatus Epulonipiscium fishelsonii TaxID=77094 RepID=A0ACC8XIT1_9FIRM|nr:citrate lyase subunit alpha [Epulopiscium sp. SCG-D08WGA-EpuloA1]
MGRVDKNLLKNIKGFENKKIYDKPYTYLGKNEVKSKSSNLKDHVKRSKIVDSIEEVIKKTGLKDGMTISFGHHFRNGDKTLMLVVEVISKMGIKNIRIASSSLTSGHDGLVEYIKDGTVNRLETSGIRTKLAKAVSEGIMGEHPVVIRSHGGRARAIASGDLKIDVAFLGVPSSDCMGNANGVNGKAPCGALGYAMVDAQYADQVVILTDCLAEYPNYPQSINQTQVDYVVVVEEVGDPKGIMTGATRAVSNPKELLLAKSVVEVMKASGYFVDGFSMQTGSGGAALAVNKFIKDELIKQDIKLGFALGGLTSPMCAMLEEGYVAKILDTQSFDQVAGESLKANENHIEISAEYYASIGTSSAVNKLDFVILSALEIDTDFNVNVISGSDGIIRAASGGHSDTAAMAKVSIIVAPLTRGRIATIIDKVTTLVTPGETIDVVVTDYGTIVNPNRTDLIEKLTKSGIKLITMKKAREIATKLVGIPTPIEFDDQIVAIVEYRDGTVIDVIKKTKTK